jgi:hypothetical protein
MRSSYRFSRRQAALAAATVGAVLLLLARPGRGQQPIPQPPDAPVIVTTVPATASRNRSFARIEFSFALPAAFVLPLHPTVRSVDAQGKLWEELPTYIAQRVPSWSGYADLNIDSYPQGTYDVTVAVTYRRPDGTTATATTPAKKLTVPAPAANPGP